MAQLPPVVLPRLLGICAIYFHADRFRPEEGGLSDALLLHGPLQPAPLRPLLLPHRGLAALEAVEGGCRGEVEGPKKGAWLLPQISCAGCGMHLSCIETHKRIWG